MSEPTTAAEVRPTTTNDRVPIRTPNPNPKQIPPTQCRKTEAQLLSSCQLVSASVKGSEDAAVTA